MKDAQQRFIADRMLGKLAKWLRICGLDVSYSNRTNFEELLAKAKEEKRIILTRNTKVFGLRESLPVVFVKHDRLKDQLKQFFEERDDINPYEAIFTRCVECNVLLESVEKEKIKDKIWPYVYKTQDKFHICPSCRKIFWSATHKRNMENRLREMIQSSDK